MVGEGREEEARAIESELMRQGLSRRQVQEWLVAQFQPADGTRTRAWPTPDSWKLGRRFAKKPPPTAAELYGEDLHWTYTNLGRVKPDDAPDPQKRSLLWLADQKPSEFHRMYQRALPGIIHREQEQEAERSRRWSRAEERRKQEERARLQAQQREAEWRRREAERKRLWRQKKRQELLAQEREMAERRQRIDATLAVLRERRTTEIGSFGQPARDAETGIEVPAGYQHILSAWPDKADPDVTGTPEAQEWLANLKAANTRRLKKAEKQARETLAVRVAEHEEKRKKQEREAHERAIREGQEQMARQAEANASMRAAFDRGEQAIMGPYLRQQEARRRRQY
jgi:hypothetical protein